MQPALKGPEPHEVARLPHALLGSTRARLPFSFKKLPRRLGSPRGLLRHVSALHKADLAPFCSQRGEHRCFSCFFYVSLLFRFSRSDPLHTVSTAF